MPEWIGWLAVAVLVIWVVHRWRFLNQWFGVNVQSPSPEREKEWEDHLARELGYPDTESRAHSTKAKTRCCGACKQVDHVDGMAEYLAKHRETLASDIEEMAEILRNGTMEDLEAHVSRDACCRARVSASRAREHRAP